MRHVWTKDAEQLLAELYPDKLTSELVAVFEISVTKIHQKASRMNLRKSDAFLKSSLSGRLNGIIGASSRFKKQQPGWNKGKKQSDYMTAEMIERTATTRFKKGQDPHNTQPIGSTRISKDGYLEIKIRHDKSGKNKNYVLMQRFVWEENYGPIENSSIVEFIDGNSLNVHISNLRLVSRKENMIRNSFSDKSIVKRFFGIKDEKLVSETIEKIPEVIRLKRNALLLNHQINKNYAK